MAIQAHLVELERKHKVLENELHEALVHLSTDDLQIVELKRRKLMVKDEIERLRAYRERNAALAFATLPSVPANLLVTESSALGVPQRDGPAGRLGNCRGGSQPPGDASC